jgi:hypothetical protein
MSGVAGRWHDYVMRSGPEADELLVAGLHETMPSIFVCGLGFDPRCLVAARRVVELLGPPAVTALALRLGDTGDDPYVAEMARLHEEQLQELFGDQVTFIEYPGDVESRSAGVLVTRRLVSEYSILEARHVIVEISSLPSAIFFPVIGALLRASGSALIDLQVVVAENPGVDERIIATGLTDPDTIGGFARLPESTEGTTRVWAPVLGEGEQEQLRSIRDYLQPAEVCPVLPFPSREARRADDLLLEHRELLFDVMAFEPRNVLYADERNPFDLYRALSRLNLRYKRALAPLGSATVVLSSHASKALSIGVLLAAYEHSLPVLHVPPTGYEFRAAAAANGSMAELSSRHEDAAAEPESEVLALWIAGKPYASQSAEEATV